MWYLLVICTLTGAPVPPDVWSLRHTYATVEGCTFMQKEYQKRLDAAWRKDGSKADEHLTFICKRGPEILA